MFGERLLMLSAHARGGFAQMVSEFVATFGLLSVIWANPAVTLARALTDTFAGIRPTDVPGFIVAQLAGTITATALFRWLVPSLPCSTDRVVVPRSEVPVS